MSDGDWSGEVVVLRDQRVLVCGGAGAALTRPEQALDLIGAAAGAGADALALPVSRLGEDFLELSTRLAGEILQKLATYRLKIAIVGDLTDALEASKSLRDFARECNRGRQIAFVDDLDALARQWQGPAA